MTSEKPDPEALDAHRLLKRTGPEKAGCLLIHHIINLLFIRGIESDTFIE